MRPGEELARSVPCCEWDGSRHRSGIGRRWDPVQKRIRGAHCMAWEDAHGRPVPDGMWILHHCDNPPCVEPLHLYAGTPKHNAEDRERRNRRNIDGSRNGRSRLTQYEVDDIRRLRAQGFTLVEIARWFGVGTSQIHRIVHGRQRVNG